MDGYYHCTLFDSWLRTKAANTHDLAGFSFKKFALILELNKLFYKKDKKATIIEELFETDLHIKPNNPRRKVLSCNHYMYESKN